jgi:hypothetical protein
MYIFLSRRGKIYWEIGMVGIFAMPSVSRMTHQREETNVIEKGTDICLPILVSFFFFEKRETKPLIVNLQKPICESIVLFLSRRGNIYSGIIE